MSERPMKTASTASACSARRAFLFVGGGLGDVARRFYLSDTYDILKDLSEPTSVICYSHNPSALDFFRFHPNHGNLVLIDIGHIYMALLRDRNTDKKTINEKLFAMCGFANADLIAHRREPNPIGFFHAPDAIPNSRGHVVIHPFGRGWGDWPAETMEAVKLALRLVPESVRVFVICADYIGVDGRIKRESFECGQPNVTVLRNLSAPAAFSLVASASRFIGTMSCLSQVASYERIPTIVLHPKRCSDFHSPPSNYALTILNSNGLAVPYDGGDPARLERVVTEFLSDPASELDVPGQIRPLLAIG